MREEPRSCLAGPFAGLSIRLMVDINCHDKDSDSRQGPVVVKGGALLNKGLEMLYMAYGRGGLSQAAPSSI